GGPATDREAGEHEQDHRRGTGRSDRGGRWTGREAHLQQARRLRRGRRACQGARGEPLRAPRRLPLPQRRLRGVLRVMSETTPITDEELQTCEERYRVVAEGDDCDLVAIAMAKMALRLCVALRAANARA